MKQRVRLVDVAEEAGVAPSTVSMILNRRPHSWASKATEDRVFQTAERMGYRASKAALNMFMYTLSFEAKKKGVIVTMVSPGLVNTTPGMENPNALSPEESVTMLLEVIDGLTPENNGQFLDYSDGSILAW